jgi:DNA processing protein
LNRIYPRENRHLFDAISETGTIFSEFRVNCDPLAVNFPIRNRIIAGLSCGSIVVEAAKRSGSLITARLAGEYNREVFAVPGSIKSTKSQGTHSLLKQGARLVETEMDIIDELFHFIHADKRTIQKIPLQKQKTSQYKPCEQSSEQTKQYEQAKRGGEIKPGQHAKPDEQTKACKQKKTDIIHFLEPYPVHIDVLIEKSGMDGSQVTAQLLDLEFEGRVIRHQGNYYSISEEDH